MTRHSMRSSRAFTLIEIMIVVSIVTILSTLAMIAVGRIKERAARTVILNNLRQLYNAKAFYFSDKPDDPNHVDIAALAAKGYITASVKDKLLNPSSYEANLGWHYAILLEANAPVSAFKGVHPHDSTPTGDIIYYPAPPAAGAPAGATTTATTTPATTVTSAPQTPPPTPTPPRPTGPPTTVAVDYGNMGQNLDLIAVMPTVVPNDPNKGTIFPSVTGGVTFTSGPLKGLHIDETQWLINVGDPNYGYNGYMIFDPGDMEVTAPLTGGGTPADARPRP